MNAQAPEKHIVVVGGGPGGLTAAMILANRGFRVTLFEAKPRVGGRNAALEVDDYRFDVGPTFLMMKDILDEVFHEAGASCEDVMDMRRLEPMYRLQFENDYIDPSTDREAMCGEIARVFPGKQDRYRVFMDQEAQRFAALFPCLQKSYDKLGTLFSGSLVKALPHMALGRSLFDVMYDCFGDERLALAFTFQSKYLGMSPWKCPGLFSIIPYIEHGFGIYHPIGGLSRISETMAQVAEQNGARIHLGMPVKQVVVSHRKATGVVLENGERVEADDVVINADFGAAVAQLFEPGLLRKYTPQRMARMKLSCSTFMLYLGLDKVYEDMPHHTIVFARDYRDNVNRIFEGRDVTDDISFYVRNASVTDPTLAPPNHSAVYVLVPVGNLRGEADWKNGRRESLREVVLDAIEQRTAMTDIRRHIRRERIIAPPDWRDDYRVFEGATFNLAHNLGQMVYLRPRNRFEELTHCYLVGGGTHPGSGLPTIYESGRIAANLISRSYRIPFVSGNLEV